MRCPCQRGWLKYQMNFEGSRLALEPKQLPNRYYQLLVLRNDATSACSWPLTLSNAAVKNEWSYNSPPRYAFAIPLFGLRQTGRVNVKSSSWLRRTLLYSRSACGCRIRYCLRLKQGTRCTLPCACSNYSVYLPRISSPSIYY
jgi:hypothetical protein